MKLPVCLFAALWLIPKLTRGDESKVDGPAAADKGEWKLLGVEEQPVLVEENGTETGNNGTHRRTVVRRVRVTQRRMLGGDDAAGQATEVIGTAAAAPVPADAPGPQADDINGAATNAPDSVKTVLEWSEQRASVICGADNNWHFFDGFCYKLLTGAFSWQEALDECKNQSATLTSIHSRQENEFVGALTTKFDRNFDDFCHGFWIGMTRKLADKSSDLYKCEWIDGTEVSFGDVPRHSEYFMPPWRGGEPDNAEGREECVQVYPYLGCDHQPQIFYTQWNDFTCSSKLSGAVCKKRVPIQPE